MSKSLLISAPALSWDAVLNMTDPDMHIFFEKGMRCEFLLFVIDIVKATISI